MKNKLWPLAILVSIFIFNDLLFIHIRSYVCWLTVDYGSRALAIFFSIYLIKTRKSTIADFGFVKMPLRTFMFWAAALSVTGILIDQLVGAFFQKIMPPTALAHFPKIDNGIIKALDLSAGMLLVSVSEEAVFRGYFFSAAKGRMKNTAVFVAVSCAVFGLIHWSSGLDAVITTAIWGILPMVSVMRTGSILPALVAHYVTDFVCFVK